MITTMLFATLAAGGAQAPIKAGTVAPAFTSTGSDGKQHELKDYTAKGDLFLYFISDTCPVNAEAEKFYNRLSKAYEGKATILGVINTTDKGYKAWQAKFKAPFVVVFDPDLRIIRSYKANASPWMVQVGKNGKVAKAWPGYSAPALKEINAAMAKVGEVPVAKIDFTGAPADMAFG
ncbi:MAG: peroxiredoxin family protein [Fimbriimonas sp.]